MNEQIEKLVNETDLWCDGNFPSDWLNRVDEFLPRWNEKFAELIVRECEQVSLQSSHRDDDMGAIIARNIRKHFGVE